MCRANLCDAVGNRIFTHRRSQIAAPNSARQRLSTASYNFNHTLKINALGGISVPYQYKESGKYKVIVKVVDILGIDTSKIVEVVIQ